MKEYLTQAEIEAQGPFPTQPITPSQNIAAQAAANAAAQASGYSRSLGALGQEAGYLSLIHI